MLQKNLYIIGGCNGAGKTTASITVLPQILNCKEFVNADEIAKGLSPFNPEAVAFEAGRLMLNRIKNLLMENENFAFETTLATRSYKNLVLDAHSKGYRVGLLYFWLNDISLAKRRVLSRVSEGGHNISPDVIHRRYINGIKNLFDIYLPIVDHASVFDNSEGKYELIMNRIDNKEDILDTDRLDEIKKYYHEQR